MKRTLTLIALFLALGAFTWYALRNRAPKNTTLASWDMDFAVPESEEIERIFLADRKGQTTLLEQKDGRWIYNNRYPARPSAVQTLLQTLRTLRVSYVPPKEAEASAVKNIASSGIKVEIYGKQGKKLKSYYVGGVTNDERGTYMMMEGSEKPYVLYIPAMSGQVRVQFLMGDDEWRDRSVFGEKPEDVKSISIEYPQQKSESFRLEKTGPAEYQVKPYFSTTPASRQPQRKGLAEAYLIQFESLIAEAMENNHPARDSVSALVPFAIVTLEKENGQKRTAKFWPSETFIDRSADKPYINRFYTLVEQDSSFLITQEVVMGKIFRGYSFFFDNPERLRQ